MTRFLLTLGLLSRALVIVVLALGWYAAIGWLWLARVVVLTVMGLH